MAHRFTFVVTVEVERESGKFAPRDEIAEQISEWLEAADEGQVCGIDQPANASIITGRVRGVTWRQ